MLTQIFQSISETATIDYDKYSDLSETNGFTDILYLTGGQWTGASIFSSGDCLSANGSEFLPDENGMYTDPSIILSAGSGCQLILQHNESITPLLDTSKLVATQARFKIIPFDSEVNYFSNSDYEGQILINNIAKP